MSNSPSTNDHAALQEQFDQAFAHLKARRWPEAEEGFRRFVEQRPDTIAAQYNLGVALKNQGKLPEALALFKSILSRRPEFPEALNNLGDTYYHLKQWLDAAAQFRRAVDLKPNFADAWNNLGISLQELGQDTEAIAAYRRALATQPDFAEAWNNLGNALRHNKQTSAAIEAYRRALKLRPEMAEIWTNLGVSLRELDRTEEALNAYRRALSLRADYPEACNNLGNMLWEAHESVEAIAAYRRALALQPDYVAALTSLAGVLMTTGELDEALAALKQAAVLHPDDPAIVSCRLCTLRYHDGFDDPSIYREAREWDAHFAQPLRAEIPVHDNDRSPDRRLRVGYVSLDFRAHCQSMFTIPLLSNHDHSQFEIFCYSGVGTPDEMTGRLRRHADVWREIAKLSDAEAARMIHQDKIDILVDLGLHTTGNRLLAFARKPAPVQVTWLGYPGTTGLEAIDYRLTDGQMDPCSSNEPEIRNPKSEIRINDPNPNDPILTDGQSSQQSLPHLDIGKLGIDSDFGFRISDFSTKEPYYSERSVRLPDCYWCYYPGGSINEARETMPNIGPLPAATAGYVTFGCLNNFSKVTERTLALWSGVLAATPGSRLLLVAPPGPHRQRLIEKLGLPEREHDRVRFVNRQPMRDYLATYCQIDICLDTTPCGGGTTSLDSLWMGVPVITRVGSTVASRAGWTLLHNLNLMELVAWSDEDFVKIAVALAGDLDRLAQLHATLRTRLEQSPLMDGPRFARNVEAAYRRMWHAWCKGDSQPR